MKWKIAAAAVAVLWGTASIRGQDGSAARPSNAPTVQSLAVQPSEPKASGSGKVLFERSQEEAATAKASPSTTASPTLLAESKAAEENERASLTFLQYDLDVRLSPAQESMAVRAQMLVRNDGTQPLKRMALQLSSTLKWEQIQCEGQNATFSQHPIDSDADHTGVVNEAIVTLPRELAPKQELVLLVFYQGQAALASERLEKIGTPKDIAERSDWDRVSRDFIGLRGFGNVIWYPVNAPPVLLGDGARLFSEIGRQKARQQEARVKLTLTSEYSAEAGAPSLAVLDGVIVPVIGSVAPQNSYSGVVTATLAESRLGFSTPSFFLLTRKKVEASGAQIFTLPDDVAAAQPYLAAIVAVSPLVQQWLGTTAKLPFAVVSLPEPGDFDAEAGAVALSGFNAAPESKKLQDAMVHSLAHSYFISPRVWLEEGVPQFLQSLWIEQQRGRTAAIEALGASRSALALAEPGTPGDGNGQTLIHATDPIFYGTKATYILWMLRGLAGDAALKTALQSYKPEDDTTADYFERLIEKASGTDLHWFFDAWVYQDRGLADLAIAGVFPSKSAAGDQWLVAIDVANEGFAEAEVPLSVRSQSATVTERIRIPARGRVTRRMLIGGLPIEVELNDGSVPEVVDSLHLRKLTAEAK